MGHEVFISYASADAAAADEVVAALEAAGVSCWMAPRDVRPASDYAEEIIAAIHGARVLVLLFSKAANDSVHVRRELDRAVSAGLAVAPLRIEDLEPTGALDYYLAGRQWCDALARPLAPHLDKFTSAVRDLLEAKEPAPPLARHPLRRRRTTVLLSVLGLALVVAVAVVAAWALTRSRTPTTTKTHPSHATGPTAAQLQKEYGPSVVRITANVPLGVGGKLTWEKIVGSGCVVSKDGTILTSVALVDRTYRGPYVRAVNAAYSVDRVTVEFFGSRGQQSKVRGFVCQADTGFGNAVISVDPRAAHLVPIPLGNSDAARVGEPVYALSRQDTKLQSAPGSLSAVWHFPHWVTGQKFVDVLRTDAVFTGPGLGGPLIDASGHVIGIMGPVPADLYAEGDVDHASPTAGSAMSINGAMADVPSAGAFSGYTAWLDLTAFWITPALAKALGLPAPRGLLVEIVDPGGPAARAGIRGGATVKTVPVPGTGQEQFITGGDLIVGIDGKPVDSYDTYYKILNGHKPGDNVTVKLYRGRTLLTVKATLTAFPYTPPAA